MASAPALASASETIPLALYLWRRIHQAGCESIMGVPGDFNLNFLDYIYNVPGLSFANNSNELNAAYAADGYSRIKRAPGCLVTTHGVGELSALNGIANAASEFSPVIHVVGQIQRTAQDKRLMIHHSFGLSPDHQAFNHCSKPVRYSAAELYRETPDSVAAAIDRVIRDCIIQRQPVYIFFPVDMTKNPVPAALLDKPLDLHVPVDRFNEDTVAEAITQALYSADFPTIMVDYLATTHAPVEARALVKNLNLPFYATHGSKSTVSETHPQFRGLYNAWASAPGVASEIESCDFILTLGTFASDLNTAFFTRKLPERARIDLLDTHAVIRGQRYDGVPLAPLLARLASSLDPARITGRDMPPRLEPYIAPDARQLQITQSQIWPALGAALAPGDVVLADMGTPAYGCVDMPLPEGVTYISSSYYGSIGFSTPAALGGAVALRDLATKMHGDHSGGSGRTILVTGDGALMLTMQEVAVMVAHKLPILIIVVNNAGYTIERAIHGAHQPYNDIPACDYSAMLTLFGAAAPATRFRRARMMAEAEAVFADNAFMHPRDGPHVLELVMDRLDLPWKLAAMLHRRGEPGYLSRNGFANAEWEVITQAAGLD